MARPPLPLGHHGNVTASRSGGRWVARCRCPRLRRRHPQAGALGRLQDAPPSASLQDELQHQHGERVTVALRSTSRFRDAADVWIEKIRETPRGLHADTYEHWLKNVVLPELGELLLRECDVAHLDGFFRRLERARRTSWRTTAR